MPWSFIVPAAISLFSGSQQADAAESAAGVAGAASDRATALQKQMFERQMAGLEPNRQAGLVAQNRLMELLGLRMPAQAGGGGVGAPYMRSDAELRNALAGQFTYGPGQAEVGREGGMMPTAGGIDEAGLSRAMAAARQGDQNAMNNYQPPQVAAGGQSADFGKYARGFNMSDFQQDPGYAFRLSEGQKVLERNAAARGGLISGGALRAATRYGQDMGSQEYANAFKRYNIERENQLNPLGSLMTSGQNAAAGQGTAAGQYGTNVMRTWGKVLTKAMRCWRALKLDRHRMVTLPTCMAVLNLILVTCLVVATFDYITTMEPLHLNLRLHHGT